MDGEEFYHIALKKHLPILDEEKLQSMTVLELVKALHDREVLRKPFTKDALVQKLVWHEQRRKALLEERGFKTAVKRKRGKGNNKSNKRRKGVESNNEEVVPNANDPSNALHKDIFLHILALSEWRTIIQCSLVNKKWNSMCRYTYHYVDFADEDREEALWKILCLACWSVDKQTEETWMKTFQYYHYKSTLFRRRDNCYYFAASERYPAGKALGRYVYTGSMSNSFVHAACFMKYHKHEHFPEQELSAEEREEIARWMWNGMIGEETPALLGVRRKWIVSLGPRKKRK